MDLKTERKKHNQSNRAWLRNWSMVVGNNVNGTARTDGFTKASHYPDGMLKTGLILAKYNAGPNDTYLGPWDPAGGNGLDTIFCLVFSDFSMRENDGATLIAAETAGAVMLATTGLHLFTHLLPPVLDGGTERPVVAADFAGTNWVDMSTTLEETT